MAEHTEVPWELIVDDDGPYITMPKYLGEDDCLIAVYSSATDPDVRLADAAFIIRAVNNHDQLLAALIGLMERIDDHEPDEWTADDRIRNDAARAAIAAATT